MLMTNIELNNRHLHKESAFKNLVSYLDSKTEKESKIWENLIIKKQEKQICEVLNVLKRSKRAFDQQKNFDSQASLSESRDSKIIQERCEEIAKCLDRIFQRRTLKFKIFFFEKIGPLILKKMMRTLHRKQTLKVKEAFKCLIQHSSKPQKRDQKDKDSPPPAFQNRELRKSFKIEGKKNENATKNGDILKGEEELQGTKISIIKRTDYGSNEAQEELTFQRRGVRNEEKNILDQELLERLRNQRDGNLESYNHADLVARHRYVAASPYSSSQTQNQLQFSSGIRNIADTYPGNSQNKDEYSLFPNASRPIRENSNFNGECLVARYPRDYEVFSTVRHQQNEDYTTFKNTKNSIYFSSQNGRSNFTKNPELYDLNISQGTSIYKSNSNRRMLLKNHNRKYKQKSQDFENFSMIRLHNNTVSNQNYLNNSQSIQNSSHCFNTLDQKHPQTDRNRLLKNSGPKIFKSISGLNQIERPRNMAPRSNQPQTQRLLR